VNQAAQESDRPAERDENGRWVKGVSGNPSGPPPKHLKLGLSIQRIASDMAAKYPKFAERALALGLDPETTMVGDLIIHGWMIEAAEGKAPQVAELLNRVDGKVADKIELEGGPRVLQIALEEARKPEAES
jgi:hypothetical protein